MSFNVKQRGSSDLAFDWSAGPGSCLGLAFKFNLKFDAGFFFAIAGFALAQLARVRLPFCTRFGNEPPSLTEHLKSNIVTDDLRCWPLILDHLHRRVAEPPLKLRPTVRAFDFFTIHCGRASNAS